MVLNHSDKTEQPIRKLVYILLCVEGVSLAIGGYFDIHSRIKLRAIPFIDPPELDELGAAIGYVLAFSVLLTITLPILFRWLFRTQVDDYKYRRFAVLLAGVVMFVFAMVLSFAVY